MNITKDNQKNQIKDIKCLGGSVRNEVNFGNILFRSERLSAAVYLVSDYISDSDPIKWTLRRVSLELIRDITSLQSRDFYQGQDETVERVFNRIAEVISYLEIAWVGRLISDMNFGVLKTEYYSLREFLNSKFIVNSGTSSSFVLDSKFFVPPETKAQIETQKDIENVLDKNDLNGVSYKNLSVTEKNYSPALKRTTDGVAPRIAHGENAENKKKQDRQEKIVRMLRSGGEYSVRDILNSIGMSRDLSEKTIQRDLSFLVQKGDIRKQGRKRWSRYFI